MSWLENEDLQFELIWEPCIHVLSLVSQGLFSHLWTHHEVFEAQEEEDDDLVSDETPVTGFWSGFIWLAAMTIVMLLYQCYLSMLLALLRKHQPPGDYLKASSSSFYCQLSEIHHHSIDNCQKCN
ncbi:hypothetical protein DCAR_0934876 [Daucus carota subsp. sativus]|uniref:Uncharacterized protein n=1 Tax=Daucus carota subsp. sativus TaxID=79200 RepID=A0AAF0XYP4_DAUCS|nr:PREDICTED: uncharacterized protein LOC108202714 [Daucus carota subsp. sativus]XP_017226722.1 PREDICTED: uncharacterized protein LOC108202714 [Daucus carota subsp. sativus]WOH15339.1 hypothetical protein DCAR_0934876 [Daucus carota subsp. sativus]